MWGNYEVFIVALTCLLIGRYLTFRYVRRNQKRVLIKEFLIKILYNPIIEKWQWTRFNPKSRTWEWQREATNYEVEKYQDKVFPESEGLKIISSPMYYDVDSQYPKPEDSNG